MTSPSGKVLEPCLWEDKMKKYIQFRPFKTGHNQLGLRGFFEKTSFLEVPTVFGKLYRQVVFYLNVIGYLVSVISVILGTVEQLFQGSAFMIMACTIIIVSYLHIYLKMNSIKELLKAKEDIHCKRMYDWEEKIFQENSDAAWKSADIYWNIIAYYNVCYVISPIIIDYLAYLIYPATPKLRVFILPMQATIDATGDRNVANFFVSLLSLTYSSAGMFIHAFTECSMYYCIVYVKSEMSIICSKLKILKERLDNPSTDNDKGDPSIDVAMNNVFHHHQLILTMLEKMNDVYGLPVACQNTIFAFCFCFNVYAVTVVGQKEGGMQISSVQDTLSLIILVGVLYQLNLLGESLQEQNEEMHFYVYDLPWFNGNLSPSFRRKLVMMLRQTQRSSYINFKTAYSLNKDAFMQIMNATYSYYMMIRTIAG